MRVSIRTCKGEIEIGSESESEIKKIEKGAMQYHFGKQSSLTCLGFVCGFSLSAGGVPPFASIHAATLTARPLFRGRTFNNLV